MSGVAPRSPARDDLVGAMVGRYQLLHRLASGGMGTVYVARATGVGGFERLVAVKILHTHLAEHPKFIAMFLDEARLAARIHHPNVVATIDVFEQEGRYCLVMDYVRGLELGALVNRALSVRRRVPVPVVARVVLDVLAGLAAAHGLRGRDGGPLNLVHRDVSPQNVLVGADGVSRLTDFGVAKAEHRLSSTQGHGFKGKLAYASPEQIERSITEQRSDLFATGIVLWEALTHRRLFKGEDKFSIMRAVASEPIPPPSSVDRRLADLDAVVSRALERDPELRFQSATEMAAALEEVAAARGIATPTTVSELVGRLAREKLSAEEESLRRAEATVGGSPPAALDPVHTDPTRIARHPRRPAFERSDPGRQPDAVSHTGPIGSSAWAAAERTSLPGEPPPVSVDAPLTPAHGSSTSESSLAPVGPSRWVLVVTGLLLFLCAVLAGTVVYLVTRGGDEASGDPAPGVTEPAATGVEEIDPAERAQEAAEPSTARPAENAVEGRSPDVAAEQPETETETETQTETDEASAPSPRPRPRRSAPRPRPPAKTDVDIPDNPYRGL